MSAGTGSGPHGYRVRFRKADEARFLSHSDLLRTFERALRRTGWALAYTQGFNPHPRISVRPALALGYEAASAALEFLIGEEVDPAELARELAAVLPPAISIQSARGIPPGRPSPLRRVVWRFAPGAPEPAVQAQGQISAAREQSGAVLAEVSVVKGRDPPGAAAIAGLLWPGSDPAASARDAVLLAVEFEDGL